MDGLFLPAFLQGNGSQTSVCVRITWKACGTRLLGSTAPHPGVSDSVGLGRGLRICILNEFPGYADTTARGTTLEKRSGR